MPKRHLESKLDQEDGAEDFLATLLQGFDLAIGDGSVGALHQALNVFSRAVLIDDTRPEPYLGLALCYSNLGGQVRGLRYFDACLEHGFGAGDFTNLCYEQGDPHGQTRTFDIGLDHVLIWRATCHLEQNATEAARQDLNRISDDPATELRAELATLKARLCLALDDPTNAQHHLGQALGWDPDEPDAHFIRGHLHARAGDAQAALKAYSRAIKIDPNEPDFRITRAKLLLSIGSPNKASEDLAAAEQILAKELPQPDKIKRINQLRIEIDRS